MDRRAFAASALLALPGLARASACTAEDFVYAGSDAGEIHRLRFDACKGLLRSEGVAARLSKPRWLLAHPSLPLLYAVSDAKGGQVLSFLRERRSGELKPLSETASGGAGPTHLALDAASRTLFVSNFGGGSVSSIALGADGSLGEPASTLQATGSGPHRRQTSPHAHGAQLAPGGRHLLVPDLGADRLFVHGFEPGSRTLSSSEANLALPAGSGPRRALFSADGRHVFLLNELTASLMSLRWEGGRLQLLQSQGLSSPGFAGTPSGSEMALSADGRFLYVGDRGEQRLLVFRVDRQSGELALLQRIPCAGEAPWHFELHAGGRWLLLANQRSNRLNLFAVDPASGLLRDSGQALEMATPLCVAFTPN